MNSTYLKTIAGVAIIGLASVATAAEPFAAVAPSGKTLVVPAGQAKRGTVYHAISGRERQVFFTSDAPLEQIKGQSSEVIGYAIAGKGSSEANLVGGEWHLPVESLRTGIPLRDEHLAGGDWLDASSFPDIVFQINDVRSAKLVRKTDAFRTYDVTLAGEFTIHGVTNEVTLPSTTLTFMNESKATRKVADGNLLAIRVEYTVTLSDYGITHPIIGEKVANEVVIDTSLYLSTEE